MASIDCIIDGFLYLGNAKASKSIELLESKSITHIISLAGKICYPGRINYHTCKIADSKDEDIGPFLADAITFINQARESKNGGCVFVHCMAGVSRSATIVIAYLMTRYALSIRDAYVYVKQVKLNPKYTYSYAYTSTYNCPCIYNI